MDAPSLFGEEDRKKLEELKKGAFRKSIDEAIARNASAFLICGDLYNESAVSFETLIFLRKCFLDLLNCNIKVCYAHGKYDASSAPDIIKTENLIDFSHEVEVFDFMQDAIPVAKIVASGYKKETDTLANQFEQNESDIPVLCMLYEENAFSKQGTLLQDVIESKKYDVTILGGYHQYVITREESNIMYLGSPTGDWFGDKTGGVLFAEFKDDGQVVLDKISVSDTSFHDVEISNIVEVDMQALQRRIEIEVQKIITTTRNTFVRVILSGRCVVANDITDDKIQTMSKQLSNTLDLSIYIQKDNLMPILPKSLFDGTSPLVESLKIIDAAKNDNNKLEELIESIHTDYTLFYSQLNEEEQESHRKEILNGLIDTICKVMIREVHYED